MEELLDGQSIEECYKSFSFLESRREAIIAVRHLPLLTCQC